MEMLRRDANEEKREVRNHTRLAALAEEGGLAAPKLKLEEQAAGEDEHGQGMKRLIG